MISVSTGWHPETGWSTPLPAELDGPGTLVLMFGPTALLESPGPCRDICKAFPQSVVTGASSGTVVDDGRLADGVLVVSVTRFEHTRLKMVAEGTGEGVQTPQAAHDCGRRLAAALTRTPGLVAVLALADGLQVNGPELVRGLVEALPAGLPLTGGMAADGTAFERTWVVAGRELCRGAMTAVGFYGDRLEVHTACRGGSVGFGPRRRVTHSLGNVVYELDGQPALELYEQFLGHYAAALPGSASHFPLTVYRESRDEAPIIRYVLGIDRSCQSITVAGDVPRGSHVQLSRAGRGELMRAADSVAAELHPWSQGGGAVLNLVVSCIGRRIVLGEQTDEEVEAIGQALPAASRQVGFYSYGEFSGSACLPCEMHNMTLALTTLRER